MNVWKLVTGVVLLLLVGILFGSIGTWLLMKPPRPPGPWHHKNRSAEMADRLAKELDLTRAQKTAVEDILNKTGEKLHEHFMQVKPEVDKIIDEGFAQIKTQLTAPQKMEFEKIRRKFDRRHGPGRGPEQPFLPPPPPH